ncbi:MAG: GMC family oxidoreductase [Leptospiraceae bacterium]|nr:GMC family oxidoreductase [Leptospiraceae bacterium]
MSNIPYYDYVVIGSGFGGSVSALRLSEKGYKVLVLEKGKWFKPKDFPKSNWNIRKWLWIPAFKMFGFFKMTIFRHVTILSGVGVGGGSLVYAATLPVPKKPFFQSPTWASLANWEKELKPHYATALHMLGAAKVPERFDGDNVLRELAADLNQPRKFDQTNVSIYFGKPGETVKDPFYKGKGPSRTGCIYCGACMIGCRHNAKNTLDKNYLYLAQAAGAEIIAEREVTDVVPLEQGASKRYEITYRSPMKYFSKKEKVQAGGVIFAGGVLGTLRLLWNLKTKKSLPDISDRLGYGIRTNSESLLGVTTERRDLNFSKGVAIGSIYHVDEHSHLEVVRYPEGSGFFRMSMVPAVMGNNILLRLGRVITAYIRQPVRRFKALIVPDWAKYTQIMLFMQSLDSTMRFVKGWFRLKTTLDQGPAPTSDIPIAHDLAQKFADKVDGTVHALATESLTGLASTAHILGGCCMGSDPENGVIDKDNRLFGYENMYVCDGSTISANIGVNPSLTITAITERAMSKIPKNKKKITGKKYAKV